MRAGKSAPDALKALLAGDAQRDVRQVGMVDAQGRVAAHTGAQCIPAAGDQAGKGYVVQANLMEKATVWPAMARAYEAAQGRPRRADARRARRRRGARAATSAAGSRRRSSS